MELVPYAMAFFIIFLIDRMRKNPDNKAICWLVGIAVLALFIFVLFLKPDEAFPF